MPEVFRDNFWGQKCSAIGKRLGTTALDSRYSTFPAFLNRILFWRPWFTNPVLLIMFCLLFQIDRPYLIDHYLLAAF
jgi:hypothetical protein